jgi:hypothetical protein
MTLTFFFASCSVLPFPVWHFLAPASLAFVTISYLIFSFSRVGASAALTPFGTAFIVLGVSSLLMLANLLRARFSAENRWGTWAKIIDALCGLCVIGGFLALVWLVIEFFRPACTGDGTSCFLLVLLAGPLALTILTLPGPTIGSFIDRTIIVWKRAKAESSWPSNQTTLLTV